MIRSSLFVYHKLLLGALLTISFSGTAQKTPTLSFSALQYSKTQGVGFSHPLSATFRSNCITLQTGLALYYGATSPGIFMADCRMQDSIYPIKFLFYPNPVLSQATLSVSLLVPHQSVQLQLVDALGRIVRDQVISLASLYGGYRVDFSQLLPGVYFLVISNPDLRKVIKFIKG